MPGFDRRIEQELKMLTMVGTPINVVKSFDPQLDSWKGGKWLANSYLRGQQLFDFSITKA